MGSRDACTVAEAARALGVSRRVLERISREFLGLPPGVVISLARAVSIGHDLNRGGQTLKQISIAHAFPTPSIMNRFFARLVGISPATYRARTRRGSPARHASTRHEIADRSRLRC